jgi:hypothetical protein
MAVDDRLTAARAQYEHAVFGGSAEAVQEGHRRLDGVEADLALARARLLHAKFLVTREEDPRERELLERAVMLYRETGDERGEAEALFWLGTYHQVCRDDNDAALPLHRSSYEIALRIGDRMTQSYAVRHLGFAEIAAGRVPQARKSLEESVRLRRELGFTPGVAAGLLALAQLELEAGDREAGLRQLGEAAELAAASGAHGIMRWIDGVRSSI